MERFSEYVPGICCYHVWLRQFDDLDVCDECGATCRRGRDGLIHTYSRPAAGIRSPASKGGE